MGKQDGEALGPRAQQLMYHHLHPSLPSFVLSQQAPEKLADSLRISYGIFPVLSTETSGSCPSTEDTGITYKTCHDSLRWYAGGLTRI